MFPLFWGATSIFRFTSSVHGATFAASSLTKDVLYLIFINLDCQLDRSCILVWALFSPPPDSSLFSIQLYRAVFISSPTFFQLSDDSSAMFLEVEIVDTIPTRFPEIWEQDLYFLIIFYYLIQSCLLFWKSYQHSTYLLDFDCYYECCRHDYWLGRTYQLVTLQFLLLLGTLRWEWSVFSNLVENFWVWVETLLILRLFCSMEGVSEWDRSLQCCLLVCMSCWWQGKARPLLLWEKGLLSCFGTCTWHWSWAYHWDQCTIFCFDYGLPCW